LPAFESVVHHLAAVAGRDRQIVQGLHATSPPFQLWYQDLSLD
jgi:hypothetical protein